MKLMFSELGECIIFAIIFLVLCAIFGSITTLFC